MNVMPVGPHLVRSREQRKSYFDYLDKLGFSWACVTYCALSREQLLGEYGEIYRSFAAQARDAGCMPCIGLNVSLSAGEPEGNPVAQRDEYDKPVKAQGGFYASMASDAWVAEMKQALDFLVGEIGFQCVILEDFGFPADVPGPSDPLCIRFSALYPGVKCPISKSETSDYLRLQEEKAITTTEFCTELVRHAKSLGAIHVGVMPQSFTPLAGGLSSGCEAALLARIPDVDFIVPALSPADLLDGDQRILGDLKTAPLLFYAEAIALSSGKSTIMQCGPSKCGSTASDKVDVPGTYLRDCVNAALAGDACGVMVEWDEKGSLDPSCERALSEASVCIGRLGQPKASVAFVFSYCGTRHVEPKSCEEVFRSYWALAKPMAFEEHIPVLTFHAETLAKDLAAHPEVQVLVFDEHFPLTAEQMLVMRDWWQGTQRRAAVAFGAGTGYVADVNAPGLRPSAAAYPGIFELIGLKHEEESVVRFDQPVALKDVSRVRRSAFLGDDLSERISAIAGVKRVFGSRANILYEADYDGYRVPVVAEWRDRTTLAVFCGFGLSTQTADMAVKAVGYALREIDAPPQILDSCTEGIVWSTNRNDYLIVSNLSDKEGSAVGRPGRSNFWDLGECKLLDDGDPVITVAPHSFRAFRLVGRRSKFLDVLGCMCLKSLTDGAGRAEIDMVAGKTTTFVLRSSPREIYVDGKPSTITQKVVEGVYYVTLLQCPPGDRAITLRW